MKSTLALLVILIGVVAYIYFVDSKRPAGDAEEKEKAFTGVTADDIEEIQITLADGKTTRLQKADGRWQLVEPVKTDADNTEASNIASSLASVDIQRVVDENASDVKEYGLEPPKVEVGFRLKGKSDVQRLLLGQKTPTGGDLYAKLPESSRVFLVSSFLEATFNKDALALRNKTALPFERDKVDALELVNGDRTLQFTKKGSEWAISRPITARGDFGAIEGALERVASLQMQGIVEENGGDLARYGLDKPSGTVTAGMGSAKASMILGKTENALVYAKDVARPLIFTLAPTITTDLFKDVSEYRRKDLLDSRSFNMEQVTFTRGGDTVTLQKSKDKDGKEIWQDSGGKTIDAAKAEDLLAKVGSLRAEMFRAEADPALKSPALTIASRFDGNKTETVTFARAGTTVVASRSDEPGTATVDAMSFDDLMKAIDAVK